MSFVLFCIAFAVASRTAVAQTYMITDLDPPGQTSRDVALGINNSGQVVGYSVTSRGQIRAFLYSNGRMRILGTLGGEHSYAFAINDSGHVVGRSQIANGQSRAFLHTGGPPIDLGTFGGRFSSALGINNSGQVVGYALIPGEEEEAHAFLYSGNSLLDLGTFGGASAKANDINSAGQVIGHFYRDHHEGYELAFLFSAGALESLGTLGGKQTTAVDINDSGQVVGYSLTPGGEPHAFLYSNSSLSDLGTLPGGTQSLAFGINNFGQVVGASNSSVTQLHAFLYSGGVMRNLNRLIPANSGWQLTVARAINDAGQIVGDGILNGQQRAFLLTPVTSAAITKPLPANQIVRADSVDGGCRYARPRACRSSESRKEDGSVGKAIPAADRRSYPVRL